MNPIGRLDKSSLALNNNFPSHPSSSSRQQTNSAENTQYQVGSSQIHGIPKRPPAEKIASVVSGFFRAGVSSDKVVKKISDAIRDCETIDDVVACENSLNKLKFSPGVKNHRALISTCLRLKDSDKALHYAKAMMDADRKPSAADCNSVLAQFVQEGYINEALEAVDTIKSRTHRLTDVDKYTSLIAACVNANKEEEANLVLQHGINAGVFKSGLGYSAAFNTLNFHVDHVLKNFAPNPNDGHIPGVGSEVALTILRRLALSLPRPTFLITGHGGEHKIRNAIAKEMEENYKMLPELYEVDGVVNEGVLVWNFPNQVQDSQMHHEDDQDDSIFSHSTSVAPDESVRVFLNPDKEEFVPQFAK